MKKSLFLFLTLLFLGKAALALAAVPKEILFFKTTGFQNAPDTLTPSEFHLRDTFCSNHILLINNHLYGPFHPSGTETLPGAAANGADSIVHIELTFFEPKTHHLTQNLCAGDTLWVAGNAYHAQHWVGSETIENGSVQGCDSIIVVNLTLIASPETTISDTLCPGQFLEINGKRYDSTNPKGLEILKSAALNGCDSIVYVELRFHDLQVSILGENEIHFGDSICLEMQTNVSAVWAAWSPDLLCPDSSCPKICFQPFSDETYRLTVLDENGCTATAEHRVLVNPEIPVFYPTAIRPEADFPNNRFFIGANAAVAEIRRLVVADRWGNVVFDEQNLPKNEPAFGWDGRFRGKPAQPGHFVFWAELGLMDGSVRVLEGGFLVF